MSKDVSVRVCVAINSYGCYIWIVNDLTDCNTFFILFFIFKFVSFYSILE